MSFRFEMDLDEMIWDGISFFFLWDLAFEMDEFMGIPIGWLIGFRGIQWGTVVDWMLRLVRHPKNGGKTSRSRERPGRSINPSDFVTGWGPQSIAFRNALFQWLNSMVYGRYNMI